MLVHKIIEEMVPGDKRTHRNAPVDDLLFKAIAAFPQVTEKVRSLARCAGQAKHQIDILAAQA